jgi:hypothetical protein
MVGWFGPALLGAVGLGGWKGAVVAGVALIVFIKAFGSSRFVNRPFA